MLTSPTTNAVTWRTTSKLMAHQVDAVTKLLPSRVGGLFMEMGTGKTRTAIELARLRAEKKKVSRVIWFCPVAVKKTIAREILKHTDCTDEDIYVFGSRTREATIPLDRFWYIVGIESMSSSARALYSVLRVVNEDTMVVVDESTFIKGHKAKRTKRITSLSEQVRYRLILTGTPVTQGLVDLYTQMKFLSPRILGYHSFYTFASNHLIYSDKYRGMVVGTRDYDSVIERIRPYVYQVTKDECLDLPPEIYKNFYCQLSTVQEQAYMRAKEDFYDDLLRYEDDSPLANGIAIFRLFHRLQRIACGINDGEVINNDRLDLLDRVLESVGDESHVVIWAKYRLNINEIAERAAASGWRVFVLDGSVRESRRDAIEHTWKQEGGCLVASESLGSFGLDFTAASTAIFFSRSFKYASSLQAESRHHRNGQTRPVLYLSLWADCGIESRVQRALETKSDVLAQLRYEINKVRKSGKTKLREYIASL